MGMESDKIKAIVAQAKALTRGETSPDTVMESMTKEMGRSPNMAVAIIQHLKDEGYDLMSFSGEKAEAFRVKFKPQIEKLDERQLTQLKQILKTRWSDA